MIYETCYKQLQISETDWWSQPPKMKSLTLLVLDSRMAEGRQLDFGPEIYVINIKTLSDIWSLYLLYLIMWISILKLNRLALALCYQSNIYHQLSCDNDYACGTEYLWLLFFFVFFYEIRMSRMSEIKLTKDYKRRLELLYNTVCRQDKWLEPCKKRHGYKLKSNFNMRYKVIEIKTDK